MPMVDDTDATPTSETGLPPVPAAGGVPDYIAERGPEAVAKFNAAFKGDRAAYLAYFKAKGDKADEIHERNFGTPFHGAVTRAGVAATGGAGPRPATWGESLETAAAKPWLNAPVLGNVTRAAMGVPQSAVPEWKDPGTESTAQRIVGNVVSSAPEMAPALAMGPIGAAAYFGGSELVRPTSRPGEGAPLSGSRVVPALESAAFGLALGAAGGIGAKVANRLVSPRLPVTQALARYAAEVGLGAGVGVGQAALQGGSIGEAAATGAIQFGAMGAVGRAHRLFANNAAHAAYRKTLGALESRPEPKITVAEGVPEEAANAIQDQFDVYRTRVDPKLYGEHADLTILAPDAPMPAPGSPIATRRSEGGKRLELVVHPSIMKLVELDPNALNIGFTHEGVHFRQELEGRAKPGGVVDIGGKPTALQPGILAEREAIRGERGATAADVMKQWVAESAKARPGKQRLAEYAKIRAAREATPSSFFGEVGRPPEPPLGTHPGVAAPAPPPSPIPSVMPIDQTVPAMVAEAARLAKAGDVAGAMRLTQSADDTLRRTLRLTPGAVTPLEQEAMRLLTQAKSAMASGDIRAATDAYQAAMDVVNRMPEKVPPQRTGPKARRIPVAVPPPEPPQAAVPVMALPNAPRGPVAAPTGTPRARGGKKGLTLAQQIEIAESKLGEARYEKVREALSDPKAPQPEAGTPESALLGLYQHERAIDMAGGASSGMTLTRDQLKTLGLEGAAAGRKANPEAWYQALLGVKRTLGLAGKPLPWGLEQDLTDARVKRNLASGARPRPDYDAPGATYERIAGVAREHRGEMRDMEGAQSGMTLSRAQAKVIAADVADNAKRAARGLVAAWDSIRGYGAPQTRGPQAKSMGLNVRENAADLAKRGVQAEDALRSFSKAIADPGMAHAATPDVTAAVAGYKAAKGVDLPPEHVAALSFTDRMERGLPQPTPELTQAAAKIRSLLDSTRDEIRALGTGKLDQFIQDYFPHIWKDPKASKATWDDILTELRLGKSPLQGSRNFLKQRTLPLTIDGIARGLEPVSSNPVDLALLKLREMNKYLMAHRVMQEAEGNGFLRRIDATEKLPDGYTKINDSIGTIYAAPSRKGAIQIQGYYAAPEPVARVLNNYLSPGLAGNPIYDAYRRLGNTLNQAQLGLSAFHLMFTSIDAATSKVALAIEQIFAGRPIEGLKSLIAAPFAPFANYLRGAKVMQEYMRPGSQGAEMAAIVDALQAAGGRVKMDSFYRTGAPRAFWEALKEGKLFTAGLKSIPAMLETLARPIMENIVPRQKLGVFADLARFELSRMPAGATREQVRDVMAKAWDSVDNRMGQLVYDNLFWNKTLKDLAMASVRSVGWNLGTIRELGGAGVDLTMAPIKLWQGKTPITHRMAYAAALPITVGVMGAVMHKLMTGENPKEMLDYFAPQTGKVGPDGNPERVQLASYMKDLYAYAKHPLTTLSHKLHPMGGAVADMLGNKDYFGDQVRNPDAPIVRQMQQLANYAAAQFLPFSIRNATEEGKRGQGVGAQVESFFGILPASRELVRTPAQNLASSLMKRSARPDGFTPEEADIRDYRHKITEAMRAGKSLSEALASIEAPEGVRPTQVANTARRAKLDPRILIFQSLTAPEAQRVFDAGNPEEKALWQPMLDEKVLRTRAQDALARVQNRQSVDRTEVARAKAINHVLGAVSRLRSQISKGRVDAQAGNARIAQAIAYLKERIAASEGAAPAPQ